MATFPTLPCCCRTNVKGVEVLVIETSSGQHITLQNSPASVLIEDANGNAVRLDATGVTITTAAKLIINAPSLSINAAMTQFSGVVQANTVITDSVVANSYTPGTGNIW
jgi:hypothetical protein